MTSTWPDPKTRTHHCVSDAIVNQHWKLVTNRTASYLELFDLVRDLCEQIDLKETNP